MSTVRFMKWSLIPTGRIGFQGRNLSLEERSRVLDELYFEGDRRSPYLWRFFALIVFSSSIAAMGLINDSAAVVIGAMLVAPLLTPIMAVSSAVAEAWPRRQLESLAIVLGGALAAIGVGWLTAALTPRVGPGAILSGEILARTNPNLLDLGIAIAAGAAGAYITVRSEAGSALPGVGIAVALIPPLATVGITLYADQSTLAGGAAVLFVTNLAAMVLAGAITFMVAGFVASGESLRQRRYALAFVIVLVLAVAIPLGVNSVVEWGQSVYSLAGARAVSGWNPELEIEELTVNPTASPVLYDIEVSGSDLGGDVEDLAQAIAADIGKPVAVEVLFIPKSVATADP